MVIEATGTSRGVITALELTRPMGTVVQKSTCSIDGDRNQPAWSQIANDVVVNEKKLMGSRYAFCIFVSHRSFNPSAWKQAELDEQAECKNLEVS